MSVLQKTTECNIMFIPVYDMESFYGNVKMHELSHRLNQSGENIASHILRGVPCSIPS